MVLWFSSFLVLLRSSSLVLWLSSCVVLWFSSSTSTNFKKGNIEMANMHKKQRRQDGDGFVMMMQ